MLKSKVQMKGPTYRSILIGLILIPLNCLWVVQSEAVWGILYPTTVSIFFNVAFTLFVLVLVNLFFKKLSCLLALSQGELLTIFTMLCLGSSMADMNVIETLVLSMGHASWYAMPENEWESLFFRYIPKWLTVMDNDVLNGFYNGDASFYTKPNLSVWLKPFSFWAIFIFVLTSTMLCINVIIRHQWVEKEKLSYPIIQLPYEITNTEGIIFQNRMFLMGFLLTAIWNLINGLHFYFPFVPQFHLRIRDIGHVFTNEPWNAVGWTPLVIYPWVVGMAFFIPVDLSFSCWFFYILSKVQRIVGAIVGWKTLPRFPYFDQQVIGGWLFLLSIALWFFIKRFVKRIFTIGFSMNSKNAVRSNSSQVAVIGLVLGLVVLVLFCTVAGMSTWIALAFILLLLGKGLIVTRIRAELGPPQLEFYRVGAESILYTALGSRRLGGRNLTMLGLLFFSDRAVGSHPMPHQLEGFKLAQRTGIDHKRLAMVMLISIGVGIVSSFWIFLHLGYTLGVSNRFMGYVGQPWESFGQLTSRLQYPSGPDYPGLLFVSLGYLFSSGLMAIRLRFFWWPLHPVGYIISGTGWIINWLWFSFLVAWLIKLIILKYGGIGNYRKAVPFFIGIILGEFFIGCFWEILGLLMETSRYGFYSWE